MTIEIYKSALCPRCAYALNTLKKLEKEFDDIEIITFDILTQFSAFKASGIKMLPTIKINEATKSWLLPSSSEIRDFVLKHR